MMFIIVMDVLTALVAEADQRNLLRPHVSQHIGHRLSICADDVVLFSSPETADLTLLTAVLMKFGEASGLKANMAKSSIIPIRCSEQQVQDV